MRSDLLPCYHLQWVLKEMSCLCDVAMVLYRDGNEAAMENPHEIPVLEGGDLCAVGSARMPAAPRLRVAPVVEREDDVRQTRFSHYMNYRLGPPSLTNLHTTYNTHRTTCISTNQSHNK